MCEPAGYEYAITQTGTVQQHTNWQNGARFYNGLYEWVLDEGL